MRFAVLTPLYPFCVITWSIETAVRTLRGEAREHEESIENTKELKLIEIVGE